MLLTNLIEQDDARQRWYKMMGYQDHQQAGQVVQMQQQQQAQAAQKKRQRGKDYTMKYKEEFGGGSYKVKIRQNKENETRYNYGEYDKAEQPDLSKIDPSKLTPKGVNIYQKLQAILGGAQNQPAQPEQQPPQEGAIRQSPQS